MAEKYSDIIELRQQKAAFEIKEDSDWQSFITTYDFDKMLGKVIYSVQNTEDNSHKPFWIRGAYGTGKSHAASVLKHLLCDNIEDIMSFINREYNGKPLKDNILNLRKTKRLFPVMLYGTENIATENAFGAVLQSRISSALKAAGIAATVKTDYEKYADSIAKDPKLWQDNIIDKNPELKSYTPDIDSLKERLEQYDTAIFELVCKTISQSVFDIKIDNEKIADWIFDVQSEVRKHGYNGLLIIWDEFTALAKSSIGSSILVCVQEIADKMLSTSNDSYFIIISHPSALDNLEAQEQNKIMGRFHKFEYTMEEVSAYRIMSTKFGNKTGEDITGGFYDNCAQLLRHFTNGDMFEETTITDIKKLFPLHPYTAYLSSVYAMQAGSSSRSVFQFIGENDVIKQFLDNPDNYAHRRTITADYLWDYVFSEFKQHTKYGAVVQRFQQYNIIVGEMGGNYSAVFKSVLLLNALNNLGDGSIKKLLPTDENVIFVFKNTEIEPYVEKILSDFNERNIINRTPDGLYSIMFTQLPTQELEKAKDELKRVNFKTLDKVITYNDDIAKNRFSVQLAQVQRPKIINFYSLDGNDATLQSRIRKAANDAKPWDIVIAAMFGINHHEIGELKDFCAKTAQESRFRFVLFLVFETPLTEKNYNRFIDYQAQAVVARRHSLKEPEDDGIKNSTTIAQNWINECINGQYVYYISDKDGVLQQGSNIGSTITRFINSTIAPSVIFTSGPESLDELKNRPYTFWEKKQRKTTAEKILQSMTLDDAMKNPGPAQPLSAYLRDCCDENLNFNPQCPESHPLKKVYKYIEKSLEKAGRNEEFNLADTLEDIIKPPFGLYPSFTGFAAVAFALRRHIDRIFDDRGIPQNARKLSEAVDDLFKYWNEGKGKDKLKFRFETEESISLSNMLIELFDFDREQFQSLKQVRWAFRIFTKKNGYPLWALKYAFDESETVAADMKKGIDNILIMCRNYDHQDQSLIVETLDLFGKRRFEFQTYINATNTVDNMRKGYFAFLKSVPLVELKDEEFEQAADFIKHDMQGEEGDWTEDEVKTALLSWRESTKVKEQPPQPVVQQPISQTPVQTAAETPKTVAPTEKRETARQKIRSHTNIDTLKTLLEKIIEKTGDESIIDDIINQL